jgi:hypothetical protein
VSKYTFVKACPKDAYGVQGTEVQEFFADLIVVVRVLTTLLGLFGFFSETRTLRV